MCDCSALNTYYCYQRSKTTICQDTCYSMCDLGTPSSGLAVDPPPAIAATLTFNSIQFNSIHFILSREISNRQH